MGAGTVSQKGALHVDVPGDGYDRGLIACQVAYPVHTDARGYVHAIAAVLAAGVPPCPGPPPGTAGAVSGACGSCSILP